LEEVAQRSSNEAEGKRKQSVVNLDVHHKTAIRVSVSSQRVAIAPSNYIAVYGDAEIDCPSRVGSGLFWHNSSVSLKDDVPDGTSTTLMLGERDGSIHLAGNWAGTSYDENDPNACLDPQFVVDALVDARPINGRDERCFSSRHPGGAQFLFADGTVKFLSEKCSTTVLRRLANRADGETVSESDVQTTE
jgi:prepilin-type processing-associated H-X9-DG protein